MPEQKLTPPVRLLTTSHIFRPLHERHLTLTLTPLGHHEGHHCYPFRPWSRSPGRRSSRQCHLGRRARGRFEEGTYSSRSSQRPVEQ